jgi:hypothetical protein
MGENPEAGTEVQALQSCHRSSIELELFEHLTPPALPDLSEVRLKVAS